MDIKLLGGLFLIVGTVDLIIIILFPAYALKLFGTAVTGPLSLPVKLHSPVAHFLIGYGFLWLRPWGWGLAIAYSGFGIVSEIMNQFVWGVSWIRSSFILMTMLFVAYVVRRRHVFTATELNQRGDDRIRES